MFCSQMPHCTPQPKHAGWSCATFDHGSKPRRALDVKAEQFLS